MVARMYASQEVEMVLESIVVCQGVTVKGIEQVDTFGNALYNKAAFKSSFAYQPACVILSFFSDTFLVGLH